MVGFTAVLSSASNTVEEEHWVLVGDVWGFLSISWAVLLSGFKKEVLAFSSLLPLHSPLISGSAAFHGSMFGFIFLIGIWASEVGGFSFPFPYFPWFVSQISLLLVSRYSGRLFSHISHFILFHLFAARYHIITMFINFALRVIWFSFEVRFSLWVSHSLKLCRWLCFLVRGIWLFYA